MSAHVPELSLAQDIARRLVEDLGPEGARHAIAAVLSKFTPSERAALAARWSFWARPKQLAPTSAWRTWGFLCGRGFGKTFAVSKHVNDKIDAGGARKIGLAAQDESNTEELQVLGPSGLIATAPPWNRPVYHASRKMLEWPNGAMAAVRTPEVPGKIRGWDYDLAWLTEIQSWPRKTRGEAMSNFRIATRVGAAQIVWDATPKKGNELLVELLEDGRRDPARNIVVRGSTRENRANLASSYVEDLERKYGGTQKGREELDGEMLEDAEGALVNSVWIDRSRRPRPPSFVRRALGLDPAITSRRRSDRTGIIDAALGVDGQGYVLGDYSGRHRPEAWAEIVLDRYFEGQCDCVVVETNRGGELVTSNLRLAAKPRQVEVIVLGDKEMPRHVAGVVYVRERHARGPKSDRAQPLATAYEKGRISHVEDADLSSLEESLTTWEPPALAPDGEEEERVQSPDDIDAEVHVMTELLDLSDAPPDHSRGFEGIAQAARVLETPDAASTLLVEISQRLGMGSGRI